MSNTLAEIAKMLRAGDLHYVQLSEELRDLKELADVAARGKPFKTVRSGMCFHTCDTACEVAITVD